MRLWLKKGSVAAAFGETADEVKVSVSEKKKQKKKPASSVFVS